MSESVSLERAPTEYTSLGSILKEFISNAKRHKLVRPHALYQLGQEHTQRYRFAAQHADNVAVLDIACGDGFGLEILNKDGGANNVIGVDISPSAVFVAKSKNPNAEYIAGSVTNIPFADSTFPLVTSFETYEHVSDPTAMLSELTRVLQPDGTLIISTPNRNISNPNKTKLDQPDNPFHRFEVTPEEFLKELKLHFENIELYGQDPESETVNHHRTFLKKVNRLRKIFTLKASRVVPVNLDQNPAYMVAVCKNPRKT